MYTKNDFQTKFKPREFLETQELSFYNKGGSWYADLPDYIKQGGTEAECLMVSGSDTLIDMVSKGNMRVTITASLKPIVENGEHVYDIILIKTKDDVEEHLDYGGASYKALIKNELEEMYIWTEFNCWLCSVSKFVFNGKHPNCLFIKIK